MSAEDEKSHGQARLKKADRINRMVAMMERLEWVRGVTGPELAEEWGFAIETIEKDAAEASRRVRLSVEPGTAREDIAAGCKRLFREAIAASDAKSAKAVGDLWAMVSGAKAAERHEFEVTANPEKAAALVRSTFGEHASSDEESDAMGADAGAVSSGASDE